MNALDAVIILLLLPAAVHGIRVGGLAQIAEFVGMILGFALGVWLVLVLCPHVSGTVAKPVLAIVLLVLPVALLGVGGRQTGLRMSTALRRFRVHVVDEFVGGLTAAATVLVVLWLFASVLVNSPLTSVSGEIENSAILRGVSSVMPPIPDAFSGVERYLATTGFPQVLANITPQSSVEVQVATSAQVDATARRAEDSVVKVIAYGCGGRPRRFGIRRRRGARRHERARRRRDRPHRRREPEWSLVEGEARPFRPALRPRRAATRHSAGDPGAEDRQPHLPTPEGRRHHRLPRGRRTSGRASRGGHCVRGPGP